MCPSLALARSLAWLAPHSRSRFRSCSRFRLRSRPRFRSCACFLCVCLLSALSLSSLSCVLSLFVLNVPYRFLSFSLAPTTLYIRVRVCMRVCMRVCVCVCVCICKFMCVCLCAYVYIHTYMYICVCISLGICCISRSPFLSLACSFSRSLALPRSLSLSLSVSPPCPWWPSALSADDCDLAHTHRKSPRKWRKCNLVSRDRLSGQRHGLAMNWVDRPRTSADERILSGLCAVVIV